jgi:Calcineurin-like phosphoesterase
VSSKVIRFIGDVHGHWRRYKRIISGCDRSIQVGDMGVGFIKYGGYDHGRFLSNPPFDAMSRGQHEFERGNHDNPEVCKRHKFWIPDGTVRDNMMFIGGAASIDREYRVTGYSWWPDEEPSHSELLQMVDTYLVARPEIMVTHECPESIANLLCLSLGRAKLNISSRCRQAFQSMFELHNPKLWIGGHWHVSFDKIIDTTRFIILNELEWIDVNTETFEIINKGQG